MISNKRKKKTYSTSGNKTEFDFVLVGKNNRKYLKDLKLIFGELQHWLVVTDKEKRKLKKKTVDNESTVTRSLRKTM